MTNHSFYTRQNQHRECSLSGQTTLCISIAARPGRFGMTVHNAGYQTLGLNYFYKACGINNLAGAITGIRALGIRGCSVSMPFKEAVLPFLDTIDSLAAEVGAVNTIVNTHGNLIGYNTDIVGIKEAIRAQLNNLDEPVLVLGTGGASRAALKALIDLGLHQLTICGRNNEKTQQLAEQFNISTHPWMQRNDLKAHILINATSLGMSPEKGILPIEEKSIKKYRLVVDMVASPPLTRLLQLAQDKKIAVVDGISIALHQAFAQFYLYTGIQPPQEAMRLAARSLYETRD